MAPRRNTPQYPSSSDDQRHDTPNGQSPLSKGDRLHSMHGDNDLPSPAQAVGSAFKKQKASDMNLEHDLLSFSYVSSHDLQEPLRKIQTFSSRIMEKEYDTLSETGKEYFRRLHGAAKRMQQIIDDLEAYSELNKPIKKYETTDLDELVSEVITQFSDQINEKQAVIKFRNLGTVNVARNQFRQLLANLISNSLKFSQREKKPRITISAENKSGKDLNNKMLIADKMYKHISIHDNGIGFSGKHCERIFELFQRLHSQEHFEGTGVGLAICKKVMDNHSGLICASSLPNKGSTFHLFLPLANQA